MVTLAADSQQDWGCECLSLVHRAQGLETAIKGEGHWTEEISLGKSCSPCLAKVYISAFLSNRQVYEPLTSCYHTLCTAST